MVEIKHAPVVVACLFAGVGAWGAEVEVKAGPAYASELFGEDRLSPKYPTGMEPMVTLTIPGNLDAFDAVEGPPAVAAIPARIHNGSVEVEFKLHGAMFDANVTGLMYNASTTADPQVVIAAPASVASIVSGGRKGDDWITIKIEEASTADDTRPTTSVARTAGTGAIPANVSDHTISFEVPRLAGLSGLGGAKPGVKNEKQVWLSATSRIVSGSFTDGELVDAVPGTSPPFHAAKVITAKNSLTLEVTGGATHPIAIDDKGDDTAFTVVKGGGQAMVGTVKITTVQTMTPAKGKEDRVLVGYLQAEATPPVDAADEAALNALREIYRPEKSATKAVPLDLYDLNGVKITKGLPGTFAVAAMGSENFGMDDMLYVDYNSNKKMDGGEGMDRDGMMAQGRSISIDSITNSATYHVYYVPGGKDRITHDSTLTVSASVAYNSSTSLPEPGSKTENMFRYDGVGNALMAYAIPHSAAMDKGNVRVRCEQTADCRVFLECFDDMGMREFSEAPMIEGNSVAVWNGAAIETVTGLEPSSRISCQILSKGEISVQQLTRSAGVLVNNTYVSNQD